jgi:hypothetical protein
MDGDIKEERDGGCYISNAKGFFFFEKPERTLFCR